MGSYIVNFTVYTMAMLGLIFFAVFIYKKFMNGGVYKDNSKFLSIEDTMSINPRKTLLVVRAGSEKFLIASDVERTTLISKLNTSAQKNLQNTSQQTPDLNNIPPDKPSKEILQNRLIDLNLVYPEKEAVKLDIINRKNPAGRTMDTTEFYPHASKYEVPAKNMTLDFSGAKKNGLTPIKQMAKKVNEL